MNSRISDQKKFRLFRIIHVQHTDLKIHKFCYADSKSRGARTGYLSLKFLLMMPNRDSVCSLKELLINNHFLKNFGAYSFNIYLFHPTISGAYKTNRFSRATGDGEWFIVVILSYFLGYVVFMSLERPLIRIADNICKI